MSFWETLGLVLNTFRTNKLRTFLTLLGVMIGVTTVITVVSVLRGMNRYVISTLSAAGSNTFRIDRFGIITSHEEFLKALRRKDLTTADMEAIEERCELCTEVGGFSLVPTFNGNLTINIAAGRETIRDPQVFGVTANYGDLANREIINGRYLTESEVSHHAYSAVIGWEIAQGLFPNLDPVGKGISINGRKFHVVGVLKKYGNILGQNQDTLVEIPFGSFQKIFGRREPVFILGKVQDAANLGQAMDQARVILRARHHRRTEEDDGFSILTTDNLVQLWQNFTRGAFAAMIGIASIALVVGGIVIMNIMLVSVVERTSEIGLRKAMGARKKDIRRQFLFESVILAAWGGLIGILLGTVAAKLISTFSPMPSSVEPGPVLMAMLLASSVGLLSGMWPAIKAARLDPIVALRTE
jgi:putative ABC transport system permease protein